MAFVSLRRISVISNRCNVRTYSTAIVPHITTSNSNDPYFNIAYEETMIGKYSKLYEDSKNRNITSLFMWRTIPSVWIGINQNVYKECYLDQMRQDGVALIRRPSGGGAVYRDLGDATFSFIRHVGDCGMDSPRIKEVKELNNSIILKSLKEFGVDAVVKGRNDIVLPMIRQGKYVEPKISGSAYRLGKGLFVHHGTMLLNLDMNNVGKYLCMNSKLNEEKLLSKGVDSVVSRIANIGVDYYKWNYVLKKNFLQHCEHEAQFFYADIDDLKDAEIKKMYDDKKDKNWIYGRNPEFTNTFETRIEGFGNVWINFRVVGNLVEVKIDSDSLYPHVISELQSLFNHPAMYSDTLNYLKWKMVDISDDFLRYVFQKLLTEMKERKFFD